MNPRDPTASETIFARFRRKNESLRREKHSNLDDVRDDDVHILRVGYSYLQGFILCPARFILSNRLTAALIYH